ncbi:MAG TPA: ribonuclease III, partial [Deltaproteobacteria bacterium]|nr:ribonuclease III [Deltaproteobacteria bacterium]
EHRDSLLDDNQRLEFLGDSIVNAIIAGRLFLQYPEEREGGLTKKRAEIISEAALSRIAVYLNLGKYLNLGRGEDMDGGREKPSILADAYEALVGAIFLDSSYETAGAVVEKHFESALGSLQDISATDYKSTLLEYCQSMYRCLPEIVVIDEIGPEHEKEFVVKVQLSDKVVGQGRGKNKKQAAQMACKEALLLLDYPL